MDDLLRLVACAAAVWVYRPALRRLADRRDLEDGVPLRGRHRRTP